MKTETGIHAPRSCGVGRPAKYPFVRMEVGQSVFIEGARVGGKEYLAAQAAGRSRGWKFTGRTVDGGLRIWRIE